MARIAYIDRNFRADTLEIINQARAICADYAAQGYDLTLRQLYYQFVSRDIIPNTERSYKNLGNAINDGRLAGLIDWNWLVDRGREIDSLSHWKHPRDIIQAVAEQFHLDYWVDQPVHVEVWVEKQALAGVVERVCNQYDVTSLACKGYISQSEQHAGAMRMLKHIKGGKRVVVLHLGDHDPSGIDMSRDNEVRLANFMGHHLSELYDYGWEARYDKGDGDGGHLFDWSHLSMLHARAAGEIWDGFTELFEFRRIALNMNQIRQYNPPPNPAKLTDSRGSGYVQLHGNSSWELDALPPQVLNDLIERNIVAEYEGDLFEARIVRENEYKARIADLLDRHGDVLDEVS